MLEVKKKSQKQEKRVAKEINGKVIPGSGCFWDNKGDVRNDRFLIECKTTSKDKYILLAKTWEKIEKEAFKDNMRIPLMYIDLNDGQTRGVVFSETAFDDDMYRRVVVRNKTGRKQVTLTKDMFERGVKVEICGDKKNSLFCLEVKLFKEVFKEELNWQD